MPACSTMAIGTRTRKLKVTCVTCVVMISLLADHDSEVTNMTHPAARIYVRVSTNDQVESGAGINAQLYSCRGWAARLGVPVASEHTEGGVSGAAALEKRPVLMEVIHALSRGDVLLVAKRDRLGRDVILLATIERLVERKGARVVSVAGEGSDDQGPTGELMRRIVDAFSAYERALIGMRTKAALQAKKVRGERIGGLPFGFQVAESGKLVPLSTETGTLSVIQDLRASGASLAKIAEALEQQGLRPKRGAKWHASSVRSILRTSAKAAG